ncbi:hypothetical protein Tco_1158039, partial [Tanacetum coccineum]
MTPIAQTFWRTATATTLVDGTLELRATIDTLEYTITEASVRSKLQLADASGISMLPNNEIFEGMGNMGYPTDVVDVDQGAGQADQAMIQPSPSEPLPSSSPPPVISATTESEPTHETEIPQSRDPTHPHVAEKRPMTVVDLLQLVPKLITKVDSLEKELKQTKLTMGVGRNLQEVGLDEMVRSIMKENSEEFKTPTQGKTLREADI